MARLLSLLLFFATSVVGGCKAKLVFNNEVSCGNSSSSCDDAIKESVKETDSDTDNDAGSGQANCEDPDLAQIPQGTSFTLCNGTLGIGTLVVPTNCSTDGQQNCLATAQFPAADPTAIEAAQLRKGKTIAGVVGTRKDCRNGVNSSIFNYDGSVSSLGNTAVTSGINGDWWDTIDDANNASVGGGPSALPGTASWNSDYYCDGSQLQDVTNSANWLTPTNTPIYCATAGTGTCTDADSYPFNKIYYDPYTELYFTNPLIKRGGAHNAGTDWPEAVIACSNLQSGDGAGNWRLPTQKELMYLAMSGIAVPAASQFRPANHELYWVATSFMNGGTSAWWVNLLSGRVYGSAKTGNRYGVMCVRGG